MRCKIRFVINVNYVDEVKCKVVPLDAYEVMLETQTYGIGM
jgi:hypothetical protein